MQNKYHIHKFGGSSLLNAERFIALKSLLTGKNEIIVVSAIAETTIILQNLLDQAVSGKPFFKKLTALKESHFQLVHHLIPEHQRFEIISSLQKDFKNIKEILHAIRLTGSYSKEIGDLICGHGEQ